MPSAQPDTAVAIPQQAIQVPLSLPEDTAALEMKDPGKVAKEEAGKRGRLPTQDLPLSIRGNSDQKMGRSGCNLYLLHGTYF